MATIGTRIYTALKGKLVGKDSYGNCYYEARAELTCDGKKKRWVMYAGAAEPSKVPPHWHGWLHYSTDTLPSEQDAKPYSWSIDPQQNMTGTRLAYVPPGHASKGGMRDRTVADYEAWKP
jgi:NADH:ubiquinone oxidoreductase subunit